MNRASPCVIAIPHDYLNRIPIAESKYAHAEKDDQTQFDVEFKLEGSLDKQRYEIDDCSCGVDIDRRPEEHILEALDIFAQSSIIEAFLLLNKAFERSHA